MQFGFSYVGLLFLLMLMVPNLVWAKNKPRDYESYAEKENKVLLALERAGEALVTCTALLFSDFNIRRAGLWSLWLVFAFVLMVLYEIYWIRYFRSKKTMKDMYSSLLCVPVAGATLPVCAFFLLGVYGKNICMLFSTVLLGIGHIGIHLNHRKEIS